METVKEVIRKEEIVSSDIPEQIQQVITWLKLRQMYSRSNSDVAYEMIEACNEELVKILQL